MSDTENHISFLKIPIGHLLKEGAGFSQDIDFNRTEPTRLGDIDIQSLNGKMHLSRASQGILAQGTLSVKLIATCVRCLKPFELPYTFEISNLFATGTLSSEEEDVFPIDEDNTIDLFPILREEAILAIPMHAVCKPDCQGLCQACGQDLNEKDCGCVDDDIDPRLAELRKLLE